MRFLKIRPPLNVQELKTLLKIFTFEKFQITFEKILYFSPTGRSLEQLDHFQKISYFSPTSRSLGIIRPLPKNLYNFHQQIGHPKTIRPPVKNHVFFINEQVIWNNQITFQKSSYFSPTGRSSGTIRPLSKNLCIFYQLADCLKQLDHL